MDPKYQTYPYFRPICRAVDFIFKALTNYGKCFTNKNRKLRWSHKNKETSTLKFFFYLLLIIRDIC